MLGENVHIRKHYELGYVFNNHSSQWRCSNGTMISSSKLVASKEIQIDSYLTHEFISNCFSICKSLLIRRKGALQKQSQWQIRIFSLWQCTNRLMTKLEDFLTLLIPFFILFEHNKIAKLHVYQKLGQEISNFFQHSNNYVEISYSKELNIRRSLSF